MVVLIVLLTIIVFIVVEGILRLTAHRTQAPESEPQKETVKALDADLDQVPSGIFIHPGHTWAQILPSGLVRVGIDIFAHRALGRIDRRQMPHVGQTVHQGAPLLILEQGEHQVVLPAPLSGTIERVDPEAPAESSVCTLHPRHLAEELVVLKVAEQARAWLQDEVHRLKVWMDSLSIKEANAMLQDGGMLVEGFMEHLNEAAWQDFQTQFLGGQKTDAPRQNSEEHNPL